MNKIIGLVSIFFTIFFLVIIVLRFDLQGVGEALLESNKVLFFLAIIIFFCTLAIGMLRYKKMLDLLGCEVSFREVLKIFLATLPLLKIAPGNSGELIKTYYLKERVVFSKNAGIIVMESFLDIGILFLLTAISSFFLKMNLLFISSLGGLVVMLIFAIFVSKLRLAFSQKWREKIDNFFCIFKALAASPKFLLTILAYTFLNWFFVLVCIKILFFSFGQGVSFIKIMTFQPIVIFVTLLPISVSGIGTRELSMIYFYSNYSPVDNILAVSLIYSFLTGVILPILGIPFMCKLFKQKNKNVEPRTT